MDYTSHSTTFKMFQARILMLNTATQWNQLNIICKYINKGSDIVVFQLKNENRQSDEIMQYQIGRYVSSNEAVWCIQNFPIYERHPTVVHLLSLIHI